MVHTFTFGIVLCFDHKAQVAGTSVHNRSISRTRYGGLEVFFGKGIIDFLLQTIVATCIVWTTHPDLYHTCTYNYSTLAQLEHMQSYRYIVCTGTKPQTKTNMTAICRGKGVKDRDYALRSFNSSPTYRL